MTFSLAARDPATGAFGMVISSSSPAVAARCLHLRPHVGVAASQNVTNPALGPRLLDLLQAGSTAEEATALVVNGFVKDVLQQLPMEFAVEAQKLISVSLEGSVG